MAGQQFTSGTETKPGVYTTEFWVNIATQALGILQLVGVTDIHVSDKTVLLVQGIVAGAYTLSRGWAKSGVKPN
jgi:hypothetical protein